MALLPGSWSAPIVHVVLSEGLGLDWSSAEQYSVGQTVATDVPAVLVLAGAPAVMIFEILQAIRANKQ